MSQWQDIIHLRTFTKTISPAGDTEKSPVDREIYANKKSISQKEFYQAQGTDLKPEVKFELWLADYRDEHYLTWEKRLGEGQKQYTVLRSYEPNNDKIEIICGRVVNKEAT